MTDVTRPKPPELTCDEVRDHAAAFVLGALDPDEADAVRGHLATCPEPHAEMMELAAVLPVFDAAVPLVEPSPGLKERIMAAAAADLEARRGGSAIAAEVAGSVVTGLASPAATAPPVMPAPPAAPAPAAARSTRIPFPTAIEREARAARRAGAAIWGLRIAAVLAIAILGGWNLLLQGQVDAGRSYEQRVAAVLDVAGQPGSLTAVLTAEGGDGPAGLAAVSGQGDVKIAMRAPPPTTGSEVYEAWVIGADGNPVPLGSFKVDASGVAYFEGEDLPTEAGIVLALTREPGPGATAPSGPPVSLGTATAAG